ncbi:MAG: hypothetical protein RL670_105 [Actinomycetota bacterium]
MQTRRATIYDVATRAGVSKSLVSLVLHGDKRVSDEKRLAVQNAISELGYKPSRAAKTLAGAATKTIGFVIEDHASPWYVGVLDGMREVFDQAGFQVTTSDMHQASSSVDDPVETFLSLHVDALVLGIEPSEIRAKTLPIPCVVVSDRKSQMYGADIVMADDYQGARMITEHLIELGHKKIGHIAASSGPSVPRRKGYIDAMKAHGLDTYLVGDQYEPNSENGFAAMKEMLELEPLVTAVVSTNDSLAAGAIAYLKANNISVPQDISITGFDNSSVAQSYLMNLTTVDYQIHQIGQQTARLILNRMKQPLRPIEKVVMPCEVVVRGTTAKPRKSSK